MPMAGLFVQWWKHQNKIKKKVDNMKRTILLGVNNNTIYTGEFEIRISSIRDIF